MSAGLVTSFGDQADGRPLPPLYGDLRRWGLIEADAVRLLAELPNGSIDSIVTDPPFGISMASWDGGALANGVGFQAFSQAWAEQALRVLKPGGHLACFSASRTQHRAVTGIEDAGFEIRDQLLWLYGSGMPKARLEGGLSSALKPAYEPILLARKPLDPRTPTLAANLAAHRTGALNIDATRLIEQRSDSAAAEPVRRWPANIVLGHEPGCGDVCDAGCTVAEIDRANPGARPSRFFYSAKTSRAEREAGLELLPKRSSAIFSGSGTAPRANLRPTVKPIALMRWVVRLVVPPGGVVLDPFTGSGSTGIAAVLEARQFIGVEREADYAAIAKARIAHWAAQAEKAATT